MSKTLLQKALESKSAYTRGIMEITDEHIELALAFLQGGVSLTEASRALGAKAASNAAYAVMIRSLRKAFEQGRIKVK